MWWWRRTKRVDLGTYVDPEPVPPAPIEQVVREGTLIGESVVRMALRNRVIVDALRDNQDLDRDALVVAAARELQTLADHEWESAERIRFRRENQRAANKGRDYTGFDLEDLQESMRREQLHREMSTAFAAHADNAEAVAAIVERSLTEAWSEIGPVIIERAGEQALVLDRDPHYEEELAGRVGDLTADLSALAAERGVAL
jgi:hypothetical protein